MKSYLSIAVPLVVLGLVFVGGSFLASAIDSPQSKLDREMLNKIELAQRMLNDYNASTPRIEQAFAAAATRPVDIDPEAWRNFTRAGEDAKHPLGANKKISERLSTDEQQIRKLASDIARLNGDEAVSKAVPGPSEAYGNLQASIKSNRTLLDKALAVVREAISMTVGDGEAEVRGANQPVPTRLEAILLYHKADLMRREAALRRVRGNEDRISFVNLLADIRKLDDEIKAEQSPLVGGTVPGLEALPSVSLSEIEPAKEKAEKAVVKKQTGSEKLWIFGKLVDRLPIKKAETPASGPESAPAEQEEEKSAKPASAPSAVAKVKALASQPEAPAGPMETVPSLADRLAALQSERTRANSAIEAASADAKTLTGQIGELKTRLTAVEQLAKDAELKMIEAERTGVKGTDSQASEAFRENYRKLSDQYRQALQEVVTLKEGAIRNAKSTADEPEKILSAPLAPANSAKPMLPERGLVALEADLATAAKFVESNRALLTEIERQIVDLTGQRTMVEARISKLQAHKRKVLEQAAKFSTQAIVAVAQADRLEKEALDLITGVGQQAAQRAQAAASASQQRIQKFIRSENPVDVQEKKLTEMAGDQYTAAGASTVKADLGLLAARICVQQADDLQLHQRMLEAGKQAGLTSLPDAKKLPEGMTAESVPACATKADEADKVAKADLAEAAKYAKEALTAYTEAAEQLKDLWAAHTSIAAVHLLMAHLPRAQGDTEDHLTQARQILARAITGREKRSEYPTYRWIVDGLKAASASAGNKP